MLRRGYIVDALSFLGETVRDFLDGKSGNPEIERATASSCEDNYWFTEENILKALDAIAGRMLDGKRLNDWTSRYSFNSSGLYRTGLIMAGNIPLVGFHDFLSVLLAGNIAVIKPSSKDKYLIKTLCGILSDKFPPLAERIVFTDAKPQNISAVIATGSNNSARYFRAEYRNIPLLARKNRYSIAVLDGTETGCELEALGDDIFSYFGLGCRNVSNIFVPENYDWSLFIRSMEKYSHVMNHQGYNDCFRYQ
ncbi:MAG: aldehyde dehydrogenase, partial [Prevotellaceae bacterium]|nr:aldehyde dehydrogenase [Prevotellaceae bacterium]